MGQAAPELRPTGYGCRNPRLPAFVNKPTPFQLLPNYLFAELDSHN